jgi:hypothetical protein
MIWLTSKIKEGMNESRAGNLTHKYYLDGRYFGAGERQEDLMAAACLGCRIHNLFLGSAE